MPEYCNMKRALKHLQRAQNVLQYRPKEKLLSEGSFQFGATSVDKGKGRKSEEPLRTGDRVYIKAFYETIPHRNLPQNPLQSRSAIRDVINANTDFKIQAIDISHEEVVMLNNTLTIRIYTERAHDRPAMRALENLLEVQFASAFQPQGTHIQPTVDIFGVHIYAPNDHLHAQGGWDWSAISHT